MNDNYIVKDSNGTIYGTAITFQDAQIIVRKANTRNDLYVFCSHDGVDYRQIAVYEYSDDVDDPDNVSIDITTPERVRGTMTALIDGNDYNLWDFIADYVQEADKHTEYKKPFTDSNGFMEYTDVMLTLTNGIKVDTYTRTIYNDSASVAMSDELTDAIDDIYYQLWDEYENQED